jgi:acetyltransferase-like isoleucine patch superfamily enzyme
VSYYTDEQLKQIGFKYIGKNVKVSDKACIYNPEFIELGDNSRIDDFCIISGRVVIGKYCHITPMCLIAGGELGVYFNDFCTLAYGVKVFSQSDDYSGETMTNSLVPSEYKNEYFAKVEFDKHVIVGAGSIIFPGVHVAEGCSLGAMSLLTKSTNAWGVYVGVPAKRVKDRKKDLIGLTDKFMEENSDTF